MTSRKRLRLAQNLPPPPAFEVLPASEQGWRVVVQDGQSRDRIHYQAPLGQWTLREVAIAAARTAAGGEALVAVQRIEHGIPVDCDLFAVHYYWDQWHVRSLLPDC